MADSNSEKKFRALNFTGNGLVRLGSASAIVCLAQLISIIGGIVCIRLLAVREYGIYLLGMNVMQLGVLLTDLGITGSATALVAGASEPVEALKVIRAELTSLRLKMTAVWSLGLLILYPLSTRYFPLEAVNVVTPLQAALVVASLSGMIWFYSELSLYRGLATAGEVARMDLEASVLRVACAVGSILIYPTGTGGLIGVLCSFVAAAKLVASGIQRKRHDLAGRVSLNASTPQVAPIPSLGSVFGPLIAPSLFFAVQSYAVTFLMIQRGTVIDIAVYGAVTRFAQVFSILSSVNTAVLQPLVSRMSAGRNWTLVSAQIVGLTVAATALICLTAWALSNQLSWILGDKYLEYASLIPLAFVGTSCYFIGTIIYGILIARGITSGQWLTIPFGLFGMIAGYLLFEPRNAKDFLLFEAVRCSGYLLCQMTLLVYWIAQRRFQSVAV